MDIRSFLAFHKPDKIKGILEEASASLRKSALDVRWVRPESIHLTVVFLGYVRPEDLTAMEQPIGETCSEFGSFEISLKGIGCFPNPRNPRVIWIGLEGDIARMALLRDRLQERLRTFGIKEEKRPFRPHLTLGRFNRFSRGAERELEKYLEGYKELSSPPCTLGELVLFKSDLRRDGAIYTELKVWPLAGEG